MQSIDFGQFARVKTYRFLHREPAGFRSCVFGYLRDSKSETLTHKALRGDQVAAARPVEEQGISGSRRRTAAIYRSTQTGGI